MRGMSNMLLLLFMMMSALPAMVQDSGLVAFWDFNDSTATDRPVAADGAACPAF